MAEKVKKGKGIEVKGIEEKSNLLEKKVKEALGAFAWEADEVIKGKCREWLKTIPDSHLIEAVVLKNVVGWVRQGVV